MRMIVIRRRFVRARRVIIAIQRKFRAAQFWKKSFAKKIMELRPFRLRIDSIWCIVHDPDIIRVQHSKSGRRERSDVSNHLLHMVPPDVSNVTLIGSVPASLVPKFLQNNQFCN